MSSTVPLHYDCSGPAIANCETHVINRLAVLPLLPTVTCTSCNDGFLLKTSGSTTTCEALGNDFQNCRRGTTESCALCAIHHTLVRGAGATAFQKKCDPVAADKRILNCESYATVETNLMCNKCVDGFNLSTDGKTCSAITKGQEVCFVGWESNNNQVSCGVCNVPLGFFAVDSIYTVPAVPVVTQRQICAK